MYSLRKLLHKHHRGTRLTLSSCKLCMTHVLYLFDKMHVQNLISALTKSAQYLSRRPMFINLN